MAPHCAAKQAKDLVNMLGIDDVPINPVTLAEALGIHVFSASLGDDCYGIIFKRKEQTEILYLNKDKHDSWQRWEIAYLYGYAIHSHSIFEEDYEYIHAKTNLRTEHEEWARIFTLNLLIPDWIVEEKGKLANTIITAYRCGVPFQTLKERLKNRQLA